jgi:hypothetical protein
MSKVLTVSDAFFAELVALVSGATSAPPVSPPISPPITPAIPGLVDITWVIGGNSRKAVTYGDGKVLMARFKTPAEYVTASLQISQAAGEQQLFRWAVISTVPGSMDAPMASALSQSPFFRFTVGGAARIGLTALKPDTVYYMNVLNTDHVGGAPTPGLSGALIDFIGSQAA